MACICVYYSAGDTINSMYYDEKKKIFVPKYPKQNSVDCYFCEENNHRTEHHLCSICGANHDKRSHVCVYCSEDHTRLNISKTTELCPRKDCGSPCISHPHLCDYCPLNNHTTEDHSCEICGQKNHGKSDHHEKAYCSICQKFCGHCNTNHCQFCNEFESKKHYFCKVCSKCSEKPHIYCYRCEKCNIYLHNQDIGCRGCQSCIYLHGFETKTGGGHFVSINNWSDTWTIKTKTYKCTNCQGLTSVRKDDDEEWLR